MEIVVTWNDVTKQNALKALHAQDNRPYPDSLYDAAGLLFETANAYLAAKKQQRRPYPSTMRQTRRGFAEVLEGIAARAMGNINDIEVILGKSYLSRHLPPESNLENNPSTSENNPSTSENNPSEKSVDNSSLDDSFMSIL